MQNTFGQSVHLTGSYATLHDIYAASQRFLIKLRHYGIDQLYIPRYHNI